MFFSVDAPCGLQPQFKIVMECCSPGLEGRVEKRYDAEMAANAGVRLCASV